jgi:hypothetical protein
MKIGDKVVCIDNSPCRCGRCGGMPISLVKGAVYVIEGFAVYKRSLLLLLVGLVHPKNAAHTEYNSANSDRFRLLDELKEHARSKQVESKPFTALKKKP